MNSTNETEREKKFPILSDRDRATGVETPYSAIPWNVMEIGRARAELNHSQTLERLAERGGLSPREALCAIRDLPLGHALSMNVKGAYERLLDFAKRFQPNPQHPAQNSGEEKCPICGDLGEIDSGVMTPWGEGINIPCPSCGPKPQPTEQPVCPTCGTKDSKACSAPFHVLPTEQPRREGGEWSCVVVKGYSGSFLIELKAGSKNLLIEDFDTEQEAQQRAAQIVEAVNKQGHLEKIALDVPLCANHAETWFCARNTISGCFLCGATETHTKERDSLKADKERLDWMEKNPGYQIHFTSPDIMFEGLKEKFPNGFWRVLFGQKDQSNRFATLREAIDELKAALEGKK